jgi:hypothetical protein
MNQKNKVDQDHKQLQNDLDFFDYCGATNMVQVI